MREEAKTSNFMKIKIFIFENRKIIGIILFTIFLFQIINYFDNKSNSNVYTVPKCKAQKGGAVGAVAGAASAAKSASTAASAASATGATNAAASAASNAKNSSSKSGSKMDKAKNYAGKFKDYGSEKVSALKRGGFEVADRLKAVAGIYFEIFYTLMMAFLIGVTLGPIIMVIIIFIVCFFSFRDQMVAIKRL
jgi:hypothetical protein